MHEQAKQLIEVLSRFDGHRFEPVALIRAVNSLHGLGFNQSLDSLRAIAREASQVDAEQILLVARALYMPADKQTTLPSLNLGVPDLPDPDDPEQFPHFPLHLAEGLPLLLVGGYMAGGEGLPPGVYLEWCANHAQLRHGRLQPTGRPLATVDAFLASAAWRQLQVDDYHAGMLRLQALRCLPARFQPAEDAQQELLATTQPTAFWTAARQEEDRLNVRWNPSRQAFKAGDGVGQ